MRLFKPNVAKMEAKKNVKGLMKALKDKDLRVRCGAAGALGRIGDRRAVEPLTQALKDEDKYVRQDAARALGEIGDARAVEPLIQTLKDKDSDVRGNAARALGGIGDARAVEPLRIYSLGEPDWRWGKVAKEALDKIKAKKSRK